MRIWLDPARLAAYAMTPQDVEDALRRQNVEIPAGRIESDEREFTVLSETDLRTPAEFNDLVLRQANGYLIRLSDVGEARIGPADERLIVRYNGRDAIALGVVKQATANPLDVSHAVADELPRVLASLPDGMEVAVGHDSSVYIERSIENVYRTIAEAVALVILIIFVFLRSPRATAIPVVTIPVALIGSFALMAGPGVQHQHADASRLTCCRSASSSTTRSSCSRTSSGMSSAACRSCRPPSSAAARSASPSSP
jgi:multidrug efflux pump